MTDEELLKEIEAQRSLMVAVATGGPKIQEVNSQYTARRDRIARELRRRNLQDPNPHGDLWAWYGRWSAGDLGSWASRRAHLSEMYQPLIDQIRAAVTGARLFEEPTGWSRVDRGVYEIRRRLEQAEVEEHFQAVGLLCREVLISLAQVVYDPQRHPTEDGTQPSETDAKGKERGQPLKIDIIIRGISIKSSGRGNKPCLVFIQGGCPGGLLRR